MPSLPQTKVAGSPSKDPAHSTEQDSPAAIVALNKKCPIYLKNYVQVRASQIQLIISNYSVFHAYAISQNKMAPQVFHHIGIQHYTANCTANCTSTASMIPMPSYAPSTAPPADRPMQLLTSTPTIGRPSYIHTIPCSAWTKTVRSLQILEKYQTIGSSTFKPFKILNSFTLLFVETVVYGL